MTTLYREYRPRRFDEFIDRDAIITTLKNQIKSGRIGHAYLFAGSRGTGKTSCARVLARAVNCLHPVDGNPCGECEVCKKLSSEDNVDIVEMDAASNNGVDDARDIREKVKYLPVSCKYKVYIIDEVHMLTGGAFNALLKTIEEPPEHVIFILATTEPQKLPQTILSRCMRFDFGLVSTEALAKHIASIYDKEGIKYTADAVYEIARLGEGSVRDALSVADTLMAAADEITVDVVLSMTGAGDSLKVSELFDAVSSHDLRSALKLIDEFSHSGKSMSAVCSQLISYARNVLVLKSIGDGAFDGLISADPTSQAHMRSSAEKPTLENLSRTLSQLAAAESGLKYSVNPRVYLETTLVKLICGIDEEDDLRRRVAALERKLSVAPNGEQKKNKVTEERKAQSSPDFSPVSSDIPEPPPLPDERITPAERFEKTEKRVALEKPQNSEKPEEPEKPEQHVQPEKRVDREKERDLPEPRHADEGEFMHLKASSATGLELLGKVVRYLRKKGTPSAARARELLSRGAAVRERGDAIAFVAPDEVFLMMTDARVVSELEEALKSFGENRKVRVRRTAEDLFYDDVNKATEFFGKDCVCVPDGY